VSRNDCVKFKRVSSWSRFAEKRSTLFSPGPTRDGRFILLYGPDSGLVRERAEALLASAVDDPNDPFSLVRLDGDELSADPSRLVDEAMTVPLFGGRRAIRVRAGSRSFASGVDTLADVALKDCRIVIEAGELRPEIAAAQGLRRAKTAVAIAAIPTANVIWRVDREAADFQLRTRRTPCGLMACSRRRQPRA